MTEMLIGSPAEWRAIWRAQMDKLGLTYEDVDALIQSSAQGAWGDRYMSKLMSPALDLDPKWSTIAKVNRVLGIGLPWRSNLNHDLHALDGVGGTTK